MPHQITYPRDYEPEKKILCKIIYNFDSTQFEPVITRPTGPVTLVDLVQWKIDICKKCLHDFRKFSKLFPPLLFSFPGASACVCVCAPI